MDELLELLHQKNHISQGSKIEIVYVASGGQHVENQIVLGANPGPPQGREKGVEKQSNTTSEALTERIRHCISLLMQEKHDDTLLFCLQGHWQAVYRILVDKGYCRDSDFDGFDAFIRRVMPEEVNKPYTKASVKQISQTDFVKPFVEWSFDIQTSKTRRPFDRMTAIAQRFREILERNGL